MDYVRDSCVDGRMISREPTQGGVLPSEEA